MEHGPKKKSIQVFQHKVSATSAKSSIPTGSASVQSATIGYATPMFLLTLLIFFLTNTSPFTGNQVCRPRSSLKGRSRKKVMKGHALTTPPARTDQTREGNPVSVRLPEGELEAESGDDLQAEKGMPRDIEADPRDLLSIESG